MDAAGIATRQLPPAQIKAFAASRGTRAKTDRIDAELIALFMAFRPDAGRRLPHEKLGSANFLEAMNIELKDLLERQTAALEVEIAHTIAKDENLARSAEILRPVPGLGPVASTMLTTEMPEPGQLTSQQAAALSGLAPIAHESGAMRGKRAIGGGGKLMRHVMFKAALVASHHNPVLKAVADRLRDAGKPHKVVIVPVARKLVSIVNALIKSGQK